MLIATVGPHCAGKQTVISYLIERHGFAPIRVDKRGASTTKGAAAAESSASGTSSTFSTASDLLDWATIHWERPLVIQNAFDEFSLSEQEALRKRPFFLLISITAPVMVRWRRAVAGRGLHEVGADDLADFLECDDQLLYGTGNGPSASGHSPMRREESAGVVASLGSLDIKGSRSSVTFDPSGDHLHPKSQPAPPTLHDLVCTADLRLVNASTSLSHFHAELDALSLPSGHRLRPSWDTYFLSLCTLASLRSNCMKRRVGAVLVRNNRVLSTGYNGTPRGLRNCNQGGCARCNGRLDSANPNGTSPAPSGAAALHPQTGAELNGHADARAQEVTRLIKSGVSLDECLCLHAEENALLECGRERGGAEGTVLYCNTCPCLRCAVKIVQTGVQEVVYQLEYSMDDRSRAIFREAGVVFRKYIAPV